MTDVVATTNADPKSGSIATNPTNTKNNIKNAPSLLLSFRESQAAKYIVSDIFNNSDGWTTINFKSIHLFDPFSSSPIPGIKTTINSIPVITNAGRARGYAFL